MSIIGQGFVDTVKSLSFLTYIILWFVVSKYRFILYCTTSVISKNLMHLLISKSVPQFVYSFLKKKKTNHQRMIQFINNKKSSIFIIFWWRWKKIVCLRLLVRQPLVRGNYFCARMRSIVTVKKRIVRVDFELEGLLKTKDLHHGNPKASAKKAEGPLVPRSARASFCWTRNGFRLMHVLGGFGYSPLCFGFLLIFKNFQCSARVGDLPLRWKITIDYRL